MTEPKNGDKRYKLLRKYLLLIGGFIGFFIYLILTTVFGEPFNSIWVVGFLAMMGLGITYGIDKP